ncbi:hypothetical protein [Streptomyces venezuelae]
MSARDELRNVICAQATDDAGAERMLDAYRAEVLGEAEAEISAAIELNRKTYPGNEAMVARRFGMRAAERLVRWLREGQVGESDV